MLQTFPNTTDFWCEMSRSQNLKSFRCKMLAGKQNNQNISIYFLMRGKTQSWDIWKDFLYIKSVTIIEFILIFRAPWGYYGYIGKMFLF